MRPTREAVKVDCSEKVEELHAVLWELGEVLVDHVESAFEYILHDDGDLILHQALLSRLAMAQATRRADCTYREFRNNGRHGLQHLSISGPGNVAVVVNKDRVEERGNHLDPHSLEVFGLINKGLNQLQDFLLDSSHSPDFRHLSGNFT